MQTSIRVAAGLLACAAAATVIGVAAAQDGDGQLEATGADADLVDRLLEIEPDLPGLVPDQVEVDDEVADATLDGAFGQARIALDAVEADLRQLFVDADDAGTAVGDAVSDVTRGLLLEREAIIALEQADDLDVERPVDSSDETNENDVAIDADDPAGLTLIGVDLLLDARMRELAGYELLATLGDDVDPTGTFADRADDLREYADTTDPLLRAAVGLETDQLLVAVGRFDAPVGEARATATEYVCVERETYLAAIAAGESVATATLAAATDPNEACQATAEAAGAPLG